MIGNAFLLFSALTLAPSTNGNTARPGLVEREFRVRGVDAHARELIEIGAAGSRTFRQLLDRLAASDLIVYIQTVSRLRGGITGQLTFAADVGRHRFVRIAIVLDGSSTDRIAALGHELQHAVEVAEAEDVFDQDALAKLYQRIGVRGGEHIYDTVAAQEMGRTVRRELTIS